MTDAELLLLRDDDIVRRAQLWATGATIHDVNELIGLYRAATIQIDRDSFKSPAHKRFALEMMVCVINRIASFMQHGDRRDRKAFPMPIHPDDKPKPKEKR